MVVLFMLFYVLLLWFCSDVDISSMWSIEWKEEMEQLASLHSGTIALPLFYLASLPPRIIATILLLLFFPPVDNSS